MEKLKPCPFCGMSVHLTYISWTNQFNVWHKDINGNCPIVEPICIEGEDIHSLKDAREAWNRRWNE